MSKTKVKSDVKSTESMQYDKMTGAPVKRLIITLAIPTVISMLVTNIYNMADTFFVSRLGTSASAAVGIIFSLMAFFQAAGFMCGHGAGSFVSRFLGAKKEDDARTYGATAFWMSISLGIIISLVCFIFMKPLIFFLGSTDTIYPYAEKYAVCIFLSGPAMTACFTMNNLLRYEGRASYAMVGLLAGSLINIAGDPLLIFVFKLGITGAGISTCVSQYISFFILMSMFRGSRTTTRLSPKYITGNIRVCGNICLVGLPSLVRQALNALSTLLLNHQAKAYGDAAIAAMSIVGRISFFIAAFVIGIGQGMQPVISFNYGAKKYERVKKSYYFTLTAGTIFLSAAAAGVFFGADTIITWFRDDPAVIKTGAFALKLVALTAILQPCSIASNMLFQSIGKSGRATLLSSFRTGLFYIPLILILPSYMGIAGIQWAQPVSDIISAVISLPVALQFLHTIGGSEASESKRK